MGLSSVRLDDLFLRLMWRNALTSRKITQFCLTLDLLYLRAAESALLTTLWCRLAP
jgi:hypothetical protein